MSSYQKNCRNPVTASEKVLKTTQSLYQELTEAGVEVLWDDGDEGIGILKALFDWTAKYQRSR